MWTKTFAAAGAAAGCLIALVLTFQVEGPALWIGMPSAVLVGAGSGVLWGRMLDARRLVWESIGGILGVPTGAVAGGVAVYLTDPGSEFIGLGILFFGVPAGALLGLALGVGCGTLIAWRRWRE